MALTLKDVVESQVQQRASGVRNALAETRDAAQTRRERFSLDDAHRQEAHDSQIRSSSSAKANAAKTEAPKSDSSRAHDKPAQADRRSNAGADRVARPEAPKKPSPAQPAKPQNGVAASGQSDAEASRSATTEAGAEDGQGASETPATATAGTESMTAASPMMAVFVAPPPATPPPLPSASQPGGSEPEGESGIAATDGATKGAGVLDIGTGATAGKAVAANAGFESALAEIAAGAPGGDSGPSIATSGADAAAATAPASASADAKATTATTAAAHLQASSSVASAPVPLGAVPMTIGLRALGTSNRFEIRLDPKELGRIEVSLDIDKDSGTVGARLVVDRPETLALLQRDASSLQQALSQTGLDASAGISLSLRGGDGEGRRSNGESGADGQARGTGQQDHSGAQAGADTSLIDLVPLRALRGLGRVDIRI